MALDQHSGKVHYPRQDEVRALQAPSATAQRDTSSNNLQAQLHGTCYISGERGGQPEFSLHTHFLKNTLLPSPFLLRQKSE
jgi:hypothetical protein